MLLKRLNLRTQQWIAWSLLVVIMLAYAIEMSHQAVLRYDTFKATAFDLGNMDQVFWNTLHGRFFQFTNQAIDWYGPPTRLAFHFEPIIVPLSLLYIFHADPRILLVFQTLVLVSGAVPVFLLTRKHLREWPLLAPFMVAAYLASPALLGLNIFDFHTDSLATPLFLYAILALDYKRYAWFLVACVLAASCKEDEPLVIAVLGVLLIWKYKLPRLGTVLIIGGLTWSFLAFKVIIPHFYPGVQVNNFWYRYEALGSSPGAAIMNLILNPGLFFATFITLNRLYYLVGLLRSTGFLPLLAPEWLLPALPILAVNLLSTDSLLYSGVYQYNAAIIPFVILAAIHGTRRLIATWQQWREDVHTISTHAEDDEVSAQNTSVGPDIAAVGSQGFALVIALPPLALVKAYLLTLSNRATTTLRLRLSRLTLPGWRREQWQRFSERMQPLARSISLFRLQWILTLWIVLMIGLNYWIIQPEINPFWAGHEPGSREQHIQQLLDLIPPDASVSASPNLNPHLSERQFLTVFPSVCIDTACNHTVQYVIVDLASLTAENQAEATSELNALARQFRMVARAEGVVLLIRRSA